MSLKLLAHQLGLSPSTVSRAINDYPDISQATKDRVRKAAQKMGYKAGSGSRRMSAGNSKHIGLIMPISSESHSCDFDSELLVGVTQAMMPHGYIVSAIGVTKTTQDTPQFQNLVNARILDAAILINTSVSARQIDFLKKYNLPFVCYGRSEKSDTFAWLDKDYGAAISTAVNRLHKQGHTNIALINAPERYYFSLQCKKSFNKTLNNFRKPLSQNIYLTADMNEDSGYQQAKILLKNSPNVTAIICSSDQIAVGTLMACKEKGRKPGHDIAVVGFNNSPMGRYSEPSLTTIGWESNYTIGQKLGELVLRRLNAEPIANLQLLLPPNWIARQSSEWINKSQKEGDQDADKYHETNPIHY